MHIRLEQFEGPLDVLLQLIEKEKLDISTISLTQIADQFLDYLKGQKDTTPEELLNFFSIASQLLVLKTRLLLPYLMADTELDDDGEAKDLIARLQNYKRFLEASEQLMGLSRRHDRAYCVSGMSRIGKARHMNAPDEAHLEKVLSVEVIYNAMLQILHAAKSSPLPLTTIRKLFNIQDKIREIMARLQTQKTARLDDFLPNRFAKSEVIAIFLALLELCKSSFLHMEQQKLFQEVTVSINIS